ncbi:hypothetical protein PGT21_007836 [Puccinia graminis f. sp. tritici]|uniref:RING-type domain-containing protein n=1 Tax=Puccinia graminis f. sp. tritici TaxID=56615 RepID=A0A5B0MT51_PUCGR|nr:hypothetical protein PGT21_007836 [Puccinia graminis f. sp. tritici]
MLNLIVLFSPKVFLVSIPVCGLPFEHGASSSNSFQKLRQSCKSIKQKCTSSVRSGLRRLSHFGSSSTGPQEARLCSICSTAMSDRQDVFMWPTCVEGHAVHRGCVDPRSIAASSCPICQAVAPSILVRQVEHQEERTPVSDLHHFRSQY